MPPEFDPIVTCNINGEPIPFMVDTGATVSCINTDKYPLSNKILTVIGFSGKKQSLTVRMKNQETQHRFLHSPSCPVNLLARDLLSKFGITIYCTKDGLRLHIPGEETPDPHCHRILYMAPSCALDMPATEVFWTRLLSPQIDTPEIHRRFMEWKPWLMTLHPYHPPQDPLHCTYNYLRQMDGRNIKRVTLKPFKSLTSMSERRESLRIASFQKNKLSGMHLGRGGTSYHTGHRSGI